MSPDEYASVGEEVLARIVWPVTCLGGAYFLSKFDESSLKILNKISFNRAP
jgi:hypothetical protein